jgi:hypothetical protein
MILLPVFYFLTMLLTLEYPSRGLVKTLLPGRVVYGELLYPGYITNNFLKGVNIMKTLPQRTGFEFRSKEEINGWPLIHINYGTNPDTGRPLVAKGVVAIGNIAFGVVSIGAAAFGLVTLAGFGLGLVSLGSVAIGLVALGAAVLSAKSAIGVIGIDFHFIAWSLIFAASIALVIWGLVKVRAFRLRS